MNTGKGIIPKQIYIFAVFTILLNFIYLFWADSRFSLFIIWNIILAFVPFFISYHLLHYRESGKNFIGTYIVGGILWLIFFPNAPYLVTDLIHIGENAIIPLWFDSLVLFCSALIGILLAIYSLLHIERLLQTKYSKRVSTSLLMFFVLLSSFGIYLGRFLRWNSWDIFISPRNIANDLFFIFSNPVNYKETYLFIFFFFAFIMVSFYSWKFSQEEK